MHIKAIKSPVLWTQWTQPWPLTTTTGEDDHGHGNGCDNNGPNHNHGYNNDDNSSIVAMTTPQRHRPQQQQHLQQWQCPQWWWCPQCNAMKMSMPTAGPWWRQPYLGLHMVKSVHYTRECSSLHAWSSLPLPILTLTRSMVPLFK